VGWIRVPDLPLTGLGEVQKFSIRDEFLAGGYKEVWNDSQG
jgi:hypothetical protein